MRKLKLQMHVSVDGFVAGPNGELDWITRKDDAELLAVVHELIDSSDTILLGRKMTDGFVAYWEAVKSGDSSYPLAKKLIETPKVVFSRTQKTVSGTNISITNESITVGVNKLKTQKGKDIIVYGGAGFVSSLIKEQLIDEFNIFIDPVMINRGMEIFDSLDKRQKLSLIDATPYKCGVAVVRYKLNNTFSAERA